MDAKGRETEILKPVFLDFRITRQRHRIGALAAQFYWINRNVDSGNIGGVRGRL
jgi:hypothetical protein